MTVEVAVSSGLPGIAVVGMGDVAVQEARERVRSAIKAAGFDVPNAKIVVNLAPGDIRKTGTGFDLPIAMGILAATGQVARHVVERRLFVGELSLEGRVRPVWGMLAYGARAAKEGLSLVGSSDCGSVPFEEVRQFFLEHLGRLHAEDPFDGASALRAEGRSSAEERPDFKDVAGHEIAKRAMQIAAAGEHGLLMVGPPGSGKTMLASRMASILPPLSREEVREVAVIHSVAGEDPSEALRGVRPFRCPHHSATTAGLTGGGNPVRPGEVSLAHRGVLFLDELAEFKPSVLQSLRQPLEAGSICLTRADGKVTFPARFMLVAASNPCPCGYLGDDQRACACSSTRIRQYQGRIGGPLLDRIDLQIDVRRLDPRGVLRTGSGTGSEALREGVVKARAFASWRRRRSSPEACGGLGSMATGGAASARPRPRDVVEECKLDRETQDFVEEMACMHALSGRGLLSCLGVARTVADIEESEAVTVDHVAEALSLRLRTGGTQ